MQLKPQIGDPLFANEFSCGWLRFKSYAGHLYVTVGRIHTLRVKRKKPTLYQLIVPLPSI
eukprot:1783190-Amphidinium_carterae.1